MWRLVRGVVYVMLGIPIVIGLVVLIALGYLRSGPGRARLRGIVVARVRASAPGFDVAHIGGNLTRTLVLEQVRLRDREGHDAITAERIEIRYNLLALRSRAIQIDELRVEKPVVRAEPELVPSETPGGAPWAVDLRHVVIEDGKVSLPNIDVSRLDLEGRARLDSSFVDLVLQKLEMAGLTPDGGSIIATGRAVGPPTGVAVDLGVELPGRGSAHVGGHVNLGVPRYQLDLAIANLDPHTLRADLPRGRVNLRLATHGEGAPGQPKSKLAFTLSADADAAGIRAHARGRGDSHRIELDVDATTAGALPVRGARGFLDLHARVTGALPDRFEIHAHGRGHNLAFRGRQIAQLALTADATDVPRKPRGRLELVARGVALGKGQPRIDTLGVFAQSDATNLRLRASGTGAHVQADLAGHGRLAAKAMDFTLDRLSARLPDLSMQLTQPTTIRLHRGRSVAIDETRLHLAGRKLRGDVAAHAIYRFRAARNQPRFEGDLRVRNGAAAGLDPIQLDAHAEMDRTTGHANANLALGPHRTQVHVEASVPIARRKGPIAAHLVTHNFPLDDLAALGLEQGGFRGGILDVDVVLGGTLADPALRAQTGVRELQYRELSGLAATARIDSRDGHTDLSGQASLRGRPIVELHGQSEATLAHLRSGQPLPDLPLRIQARVPRLDLAELRGLTDKLAGYQGILSADADVTGTVRHPHVRADVAMVQAAGRLQAHGAYDHASDAITADVKASHVQLGFARVFIKQMRDLAGVLDADVKIRGTPAAPTLAGRVAIAQGVIGIVGQPTFRDVEVQLALVPGRVDIQKVHARSNGTFDASGSADLRGLQLLQLVLTGQAKSFAVAIEGTTGRIDGRFGLQAALRDEVLAGRVQVPEATLWIPRISGGRRLQRTRPHPDVKFVDRAGRAAAQKAERQPVAGRLERIQIQTQAPTIFVRSREVNLEVDAQTEVKTNDQGQPIVTGVVSIRRGTIEINGQRFDIEHARLMFNGEPQLNPGLDIQLQRAYGDHTALISLRGTMEKPELTFASDPPDLDSSQVIGMIMTGGPLTGDPSASQFNVAGSIATAILGKLADQIAPHLGMDVLRVSTGAETTTSTAAPFKGATSELSDTRVEVGKYLSPRILVSFVRVFGATENQNQNEARVEYRMTRRWVMETAFGDAGVGAIDFLWTWRY
jgi:autotransporter translocation and assembly factor TamB